MGIVDFEKRLVCIHGDVWSVIGKGWRFIKLSWMLKCKI